MKFVLDSSGQKKKKSCNFFCQWSIKGMNFVQLFIQTVGAILLLLLSATQCKVAFAQSERTLVTCAPSNGNVVAAIKAAAIWVTKDNGKSWRMTSSLPRYKVNSTQTTEFLKDDELFNDSIVQESGLTASESSTAGTDTSVNKLQTAFIKMAVTDSGTLWWWHPTTQRLQKCDDYLHCQTIQNIENVRVLTSDFQGRIWVATNQFLYVFKENRILQTIALPHITHIFTLSKEQQIVVITNQTITIFSQNSRLTAPLKRFSISTKEAAVFKQKLFIGQRGHIYSVGQDGSLQNQLTKVPFTGPFLISSQGIWRKQGDYWHNRQTKRMAKDVAISATLQTWILTHDGPKKLASSSPVSTQENICRPQIIQRFLPSEKISELNIPKPQIALLPKVSFWFRVVTGVSTEVDLLPQQIHNGQRAYAHIGFTFTWNLSAVSARRDTQARSALKRQIHKQEQLYTLQHANLQRAYEKYCTARQSMQSPLHRALNLLTVQQYQTLLRHLSL